MSKADRNFLPRRVIPGWLGEARAAGLLAYALDNESRFVPAGIEGGGMGARIDAKVRQSLKLDDLGVHRRALKERILQTLPALEADLGHLQAAPKAITLEMVAHGDGAYFRPHLDTVVGAGALERKGRRRLSLVYYLHRRPKAFSGGNLRFYSLGGEAWRDVVPEHDLMVAFPSWAEHSVEPVAAPSRRFADSRFAINAWIYD